MVDSVILLEAVDLCKQHAPLFEQEEEEKEEMFNLKLFFFSAQKRNVGHLIKK